MKNIIDKGIGFISIYDTESYALRILSAILNRGGYLSHQVYFKKLYSSNFPYTDKEVQILIDLLVKLKIKLLCVSLRSSSLKSFSLLVNIIKRAFPELHILIGGTHAILSPYDALKYADAICVGEGEEVILETAKQYNGTIKSLTGIKDLWVKDDKETIVESGKRGVFADLDSLPVEIYEDDNKYLIENDIISQGELLIESSWIESFASRGCPRQCTYCSNSELKKIIPLEKQKYVRIKSVNSVINDLVYLKNRFKRLKKIVFADEVFGLQKEWVQEFCEVYPVKIGLPFSALFYATLIDEEKISLLKSAGLSHGRIGIQSGSEDIRKNLYKRIETNEQIIKAGKLFNKYGIRFTYDLIVNNPYETDTDKLETLQLLAQIPRPFELNLHSLVYFPNTELTNKALLDGIIGSKEVEGENSCKGLFLTDVLSMWQGNDVFWNSLFSLTSKDFVPYKFILYLAKNKFFNNHKILLLYLAKFATFIKMMQIGIHLIISREITLIDAWKVFISLIFKPLTNK